jgi:hypothetical protein
VRPDALADAALQWSDEGRAREVAALLALDHDGRSAALTLAQWLVLGLNPNDSHGLRGPLMRLYVPDGRYVNAIAVEQRYPGDFVELTLRRVLALCCAGRMDDAASALRAAAAQHTRAVKALLAEQVRPARSTGTGIALGGAEEAWRYRELHRELWREKGALDWVTEALARWRPRKRRASSTGRQPTTGSNHQIELPLPNDS